MNTCVQFFVTHCVSGCISFLIVICCISSPSCLHHLQVTVRRWRCSKGRLLLCPRLIVFLLCASLDNFFSMHWIFSFGVQLHFFVPLLISLRSSFIIQSDGFFFFCNLCDIIIRRWTRDNGKDACRTTWRTRCCCEIVCHNLSDSWIGIMEGPDLTVYK